MRVWHLSVAAAVLFGFGCNKSPEGGTPNTSASFKVSLPATSQDVKQDNTRTVDGSITRGSDFKKDVKLKVEGPEKISAKLTKDTIKASDSDLKFGIDIHPAKDAPIGKHTIKVTGTPDGGGEATTGTFEVNVTENK